VSPSPDSICPILYRGLLVFFPEGPTPFTGMGIIHVGGYLGLPHEFKKVVKVVVRVPSVVQVMLSFIERPLGQVHDSFTI